eukprot:CAMPEP_0176048422 /NCGR_PEP_ID=MMETSP0120_2-20121206/24054_1 /TAXON_ID=160619 /ORGANISM="Kryptoperidinium foliaceum, Strain CCMP 1326" /LENGTH=557 /DNA_ID=CAMNT_0017381841 /DNA_START=124 /DNA_END=1797 /DNA_ORIENTATION=-
MALAERELSIALVERAKEYRTAVASRRGCIAAADRFYRDLMVYQWRLDALDAQMAAVSAAVMQSTSSSAGCGGETSHDDAEEVVTRDDTLRVNALNQSMEVIDQQEASAVAALEERAKYYMVCAPATTGRLERMATTEAEHRRAVDGFLELARSTYEEIEVDARNILQVAPGAEGLQSLSAVMERHRCFWQGQLEETWTAWQDATRRMHRFGDEALRAWAGMAKAFVGVHSFWPQGLFDTGAERQGGSTPSSGGTGNPRGPRRPQPSPPAEVLQALAAAVASALEAELLDPLGLSGLRTCDIGGSNSKALRGCLGRSLASRTSLDHSDEDVGDRRPSSSSGRSKARIFSPDARLTLLVSMLELLRSADALHRLGDAMLDSAPTWTAAATSMLPAGAATKANDRQAAAGGDAADDGDIDTEAREVRQAPNILQDWIADCLLEALCEASRCGDARRVRSLLCFAVELGGDALADKLRSLPSRASGLRGGLTALQLAAAGKHGKTCKLLEEWPLSEFVSSGMGSSSDDIMWAAKSGADGPRPSTPTFVSWIQRALVGAAL